MRRPYCCEASRGMYEEYYTRQQKGNGGMPVYMGATSQRGHGLGNMLGSLFRRILPFLKQNAIPLLQRGAAMALRTGATVVDDVHDGQTVKESLKERVPSGIKSFVSSIINQSGSGAYRRNKSIKRKKTRKIRQRHSTKRRKTDIFS